VYEPLFGTELRRLRMVAGLSLAELSARVHYSKGYLSKIETGARLPSPDLARACDGAVDAGGALAMLLPKRTEPAWSEPWDGGVAGQAECRHDGAVRQVLAGPWAMFEQLRSLGQVAAHGPVLPTAVTRLRELAGRLRTDLLLFAARCAEYAVESRGANPAPPATHRPVPYGYRACRCGAYIPKEPDRGYSG
jgi:transcriptional regulator with XRE-family HTH domain